MAEFMNNSGFCLGNSRGEYLVQYESSTIMTRVVWSPDPSLAKIFPTINQAKRFSRRMGEGLSIWQLSESPDNYYLTSVIT